MTLSTVDAKPALVVVDLQKGIVGLSGEDDDDMKQVIQHAAELAGAFRSLGLPVALVSILGDAPGRTEVSPPGEFTPQPGWADPVDDLDAQPRDIRVLRQRWSAFGGTPLHAELQRAGVTQVVLAGRCRHQHRGGVLRPGSARARLQRGARHRRDDRPEPRRSSQQHQVHLSPPGRDRDHRRNPGQAPVRQPLTATVSPLAVADRRAGHSFAQLCTRSDALEITLRFLQNELASPVSE